MSSCVRLLAFLTGLIFTVRCAQEPVVIQTTTSFKEISRSHTGIDFNNLITESAENNHLVWESIYNGGGVGIADINNDGLMDIYFGGNMVVDKLYLNKGNLKFEDITQSAGINESSWTAGINMVDVNNDGLVDIYLSKMSWYKDNEEIESRTNRLYINQGNNTFKELAEVYGIADKGHSTQSSFFDYDHDGDLDLYVMNAPSHRYDQKLIYMKKQLIPYDFKDHFYQNIEGKFIDKTNEIIGIQEHAYGLGLVTQDLNQDGWVDIYIANDFEKPDLMLINDQNGKFNNEILNKLKHISYSSMGMDVADINNDGLFDIGVLDMQSQDHVRSKTNMPSMNIAQFWSNVSKGYHFQFMSNMLQINNGVGFYSEIGQMSGLASTDWSWSLLLADIDNDGWKDALITNGINRNIKDNDFNVMMENNKDKKVSDLFALSKKTKIEPIPNFAFKNNGDLTFSNVSEKWDFNKNGFSFGSAYADLDNDGDLDMVVNNSNHVASIYENHTTNKSLRIKVKENGRTVLNAKAEIHYNNKKQVGELHNIRGYQSSSEPILHFGLGHAEKVDKVIITMLDGRVKIMNNVKAGETLIVDMESAQKTNNETKRLQPLLEALDNVAGIQYYHVENPYNDYEYQILRPHMETMNGPFASVGDVNGDGTDDLFLGAAKGDFGLIYLQSNDGKMIYKPNSTLDNDRPYEDMGSTFIDVDNDGDLDLYVVSGGSEEIESSPAYLDRLYINDGSGAYTRIPADLPTSNGSIVLPIDVNNDGWMDLFVGGRMKGNTYPYPGQSHVVLNNEGVLGVDKTFNLNELGMVTSAITKDIDNDGRQDLIIVGEWMRPVFLINTTVGWENQTDKYLAEKLNGWWFEIKSGDINGDGTEEFILGNIGMNNKYRATKKNPIKVYAADYNDDKKSDIVLAKNTAYGEVPVRGFECSSQQLPFLKEKFDSYNSFANAEIKDIIDLEKTNGLQLEANEFRSGYLKLENDKYIFHPFPNEGQISCTRAIHCQDFDKDGYNDVLIAGNLFEAEVETVRHDASIGLLMMGGKDGLTPIPQLESGFYAAGNVRDLKYFKLDNRDAYLVLNNNNKPQLFIK